MNISIAFHVVGICIWLGTLILGSRILAILADNENIPVKLTKSLSVFLIAGLVITVLTGVAQISIGGAQLYFSQGWFHTKLTLVLVLLVLSAIFFAHMSSIASKISKPKKSLLMAIHGISSLILVANVFLTVLFEK